MTSAGLLFAAAVSVARAASPSAVGDLILTEVQADTSAVPDYYGEWFEVYNNSGRNLDLDGVVITRQGGDGFTVSTQLLVAAGDYVVFGASEDPTRDGVFEPDYVYTWASFDMEFEADTLTLTYGSLTIDEVVWSDAWNLSRDFAHQVSRNADTLEWANDLSENWCSSPQVITGTELRGTPGSLNEWCSSQQPGADNDGDGYTEDGGDCNDTDPLVNPDALDGDDGVPQDQGGGGERDDDADCDGVRDDGTTDDDGDGYTEVDGDCNDGDVDTFPGADEGDVPDGEDNDCNDCVDDLDDDGDGYGYSAECLISEDCDDFDANVNPGESEIPYDGIDQDCVGGDECDVDADGYRALECIDQVGTDCNDDNAQVHPGAVEEEDGQDNDCDGIVDTPDLDGDGYTRDEGDCLDVSPTDTFGDVSGDVHPGAAEKCGDQLDNDCDGFYDNLPDCTQPAATGTVRGGGFCGVPADAGLGMLMMAMGMLAARRRGGKA